MKILKQFFSPGDSCMPLSQASGKHVQKYQHFRDFLGANRQALRELAAMETLYYSGRSFTAADIDFHYESLYGQVRSLIFSLNAMAEDRYAVLLEKADAVNSEVAALLREIAPRKKLRHVEALADLPENSLHSAGGKAVNLSIIAKKTSLPVPPGFVATACGFDHFLRENKLDQLILDELAGLSPGDAELGEVSARLRGHIRAAAIPPAMLALLHQHYDQVEQVCGGGVRLAVRSSAVREDSEASFAGQYESVLNVARENLAEAYKEVLASSFSPRAIAYRQMAGIQVTETPMCVLCMAMVEPAVSGVLYTADPSSGNSGEMHISAVLGLGEQLVSGDAASDSYVVERASGRVLLQDIVTKNRRMGLAAGEGTEEQQVPWQEARSAALQEQELAGLLAAGAELEQIFGGPQDIEWAIDRQRRLYILQSRPLQVVARAAAPLLLPEGVTPLALAGDAASHGAAAGPVYVVSDQDSLAAIPDQVVLVARSASPRYAEVIGRIRALITEVGSTTCHLASVAREFGVPMAINVSEATKLLADGDLVTLFAGKETRLYQGVQPLPEGAQQPRKRILDSSVHRKMRAVLDQLSPLHLTNPQAPDFLPENCRSLHDIIRFAHEQVVREMFSLSAAADSQTPCVKLTTHIPLTLYCIDLGGGLQAGLSTCDRVTAEHFSSCPVRALWRGFCHPGINWSGTVQFDGGSFLSRMAASATSEFGAAPGGDSFALIGADYLNFSAKFGYHFATLDTLCSEEPDHNYLSLQFSGGAGSFYGKTLRLQFLGKILSELGLTVTLEGDLLEGSLQRFRREEMLETLDHLGRLLACSRLLDMVISNQQDVEQLAAEFLQGNYNLLRFKEQGALACLYIHHGEWQLQEEDDRLCCLADGSATVNRLSTSVSGLIARTFGRSYLDLLDTVGAYYSFPLAVAKSGIRGDGQLHLDVKLLRGTIDQAGGLVFGLRDIGNYFVFRINALEDTAALFEFIDSKRRKRAEAKLPVTRGEWHRLTVSVTGGQIDCAVNGVAVCRYLAEKPAHGHIGLWTKADSVTLFADLCRGEQPQSLIFQ